MCLWRSSDQQRDADAPRGLPEDGDQAGVSSEGPDVLLHPAQRLHLVQHAQVSGYVPVPGAGEGTDTGC